MWASKEADSGWRFFGQMASLPKMAVRRTAGSEYTRPDITLSWSLGTGAGIQVALESRVTGCQTQHVSPQQSEALRAKFGAFMSPKTKSDLSQARQGLLSPLVIPSRFP